VFSQHAVKPATQAIDVHPQGAVLCTQPLELRPAIAQVRTRHAGTQLVTPPDIGTMPVTTAYLDRSISRDRSHEGCVALECQGRATHRLTEGTVLTDLPCGGPRQNLPAGTRARLTKFTSALPFRHDTFP
jgi:hypothetical protein